MQLDGCTDRRELRWKNACFSGVIDVPVVSDECFAFEFALEDDRRKMHVAIRHAAWFSAGSYEHLCSTTRFLKILVFQPLRRFEDGT